MLGSVIRNYAIFVGVMIVAVILLRDNTTLFSTDNESYQPERIAQTPERSVVHSNPTEEELLQRGDDHSEETDPAPTTPGQMVVQAGPGGHFFVDAEIDGNDVGFIVDTGATMVALSRADAETLGLSAHQLDYTGRANTANGIARFAPVTLSQISIGDIVVNNVQAVVMEVPMQKSLLGMSFLKRLESFEVKNDQLIMRW